MSNTSTWRGVAAATVTAVAVSVVWILACVWVGSLIGTVFPTSGVNENVTVIADGTPLIDSRSRSNYEVVSYRTLDGAPVQLETDAGLLAAGFKAARRDAGVVERPIHWSSRVVGAHNFASPGDAWYLIHDGRRPGKACFEVFDKGSKSRIGYYGRRGVRQTIPDHVEWFDTGARDFGWGERTAYTGHCVTGPGQYVWSSGRTTDEGAITPWMLYLKDSDAVLEVDLRRRAHRELLAVEGLLAVATLAEPLPKDASPEERKQADPKPGGAPTGAVLFRVTPTAWTGGSDTFTFSYVTPRLDTERKTKQRLAIRGAETITLVDPKTDKTEVFKLPAWARDRDLTVYSVGGGQLLLRVGRGYWSGGPRVELVWIDKSGAEQRRENLELAGYVPPSERSKAWQFAGGIPMPIAWAGEWLGLRPFAILQRHGADDYSAAVRQSTAERWPPGLVVLVAGLLVAAAVFAIHRAGYRSQPAVWAVAMGLLGPAGLVAYLLSHRRPPLAACGACGKTVPRDREACPACGAEWALPASNGVEIFDLEAA